MPASIQVEIEHRRYVEIVPARREAHGRLYITTMEPGQRRALIKLFVERRGRRTPLQTIDVRDLPADRQRRLPMQLSARILPAGRMRVRLYVERELFVERVLPVGHLLGPSRMLAAAAAALLFLLTIGTALWMLRAALRPLDEPPAPLAVESEEVPEVSVPPEDPAGVDDPHRPDRPDDPIVADEPAEPDAEVAAEPGPPVESEVTAEVHTVGFEPESAFLISTTRVELVAVAQRLEQHEMAVRLDGHTAIAGTAEGRRSLSRRRAEAVRDFLVDEGVDSARFVELRALGASQPLTREPDEQQRNRRVEIVELEE